MAHLINLQTYTDNRGNLTVVERILPFDIKRIFYIYGVDDSVRGGHRHKITKQAAVCIQGECTVSSNNGISKQDFRLDHPSKCLFIETEDWHTMHNFSPNAILMVFASEYYDFEDYIFEPYRV